MICKELFIYLKINKAKQTFANLPIFGCIHEGLYRLYTSYRQVEPKLRRKVESFSEIKSKKALKK